MSPEALRYALVRIARGLLSIWAVATLVFLLIRAVPGDPVDNILGDGAGAEERGALRKALHLDVALPAQYAAFATDVVNGTLGTSFQKRDRSVSSLLLDALPATLELAFASVLISLLIALPLGLTAAVKKHSWWDRGASLASAAGLAIPLIWLGPLAILFFGVKLRWLPLPGDESAQGFRGLVLPALCVGASLSAIVTRQARAAMSEVLGELYITAARAKGLRTSVVIGKHALRNAMLPIVTLIAAQFGGVLSGAVIAERIFERQGIGSLFIEAFFARDIPVIQGCVLFVAVIYVAVNLAVDLLYAWLDPRVQLR